MIALPPARRSSLLGPAAVGLPLVLIGLSTYGIVTGNTSLVVNGAIAVPLVFLPRVLAWRYGLDDHRLLTVWIALAAVVHLVGFLGPYRIQTGPLAWYDQAAHAITASFIAGVGYALVVGIDRGTGDNRFPGSFRFVFTICLVMAFGVAWEIVEFTAAGLASRGGGNAALVQYGMDDIVADLTFNTLAAAVVAVWGTGYFDGISAVATRRVQRLRRR